MKKLLLSLIIAFALLFTFGTAETKAQDENGLFIQGGYDWLDGAVAGGVQIGYLRLSVGWFPTKMPGSNESVSGACWTATWEGSKWYESGYYLSIGQNSAGYRYQASYNGGAWTGDIIEPMTIIMFGYRAATYDGLYLKGGAGYGWCQYASSFTYGISLGYTFGM